MDLTIIIPCYNDYRSLKKILKTMPQNRNIQKIVIDDNSNLPNFEQIKKLKKKFNFELFKNNRNKGAGACRNIGLENAKGEWLIFADSDDFFTKEFYKTVSYYFNSKFDIIYFAPTSIFHNNSNVSIRHLSFQNLINSYLKDASKKNEFSLRYKFIAPWSQMIKKKFIEKNKIKFDEIITSNDVMFASKIGYFVKNFAVSKKVIYCIVDRKDSLTKNLKENFFDIRLNTRISRIKFLKKKLHRGDFRKYLNDYFSLKSLEFLFKGLKYFGLKKFLKILYIYKINKISFYSLSLINPYKITKYIILNIYIYFRKIITRTNVKN